MKHFIDTSATDLSRARTAGLTNLCPSPFPVLIAGRKSSHSFFFAEAGTVESWSGNASYGMKLTVGDVISGPIASTWSLSVAGGDAITGIPWDIDATGLQTLLNDHPVVGDTDGGVIVSQTADAYLIAYKTLGIKAALTPNVTVLVPDITVTLTALDSGSNSTRQLLTLELNQTTPFQSTNFTNTNSPYNGWTGTIDLTGTGVTQLMEIRGKRVGPYIEADTVLTVEVGNPNVNYAPYYQTPITLRSLNYP